MPNVFQISNESVDLIIPFQEGSTFNIDYILQRLSEDAECIRTIYVVHSRKANIRSSSALQSSEYPRDEDISSQPANRLGLCIDHVFVAKPVFPGAARNIGIKRSRAKFIAFLDVNTLPPKDWLKTSLTTIDKLTLDWLPGKTRYIASNYIQKMILAASTGFNPLITLPGSVISRKCFVETGYMLTDVRAAEDISFMRRLRSFYPQNVPLEGIPELHYKLQSSNPVFYIYKWFRNYSSSEPYVILGVQKLASSFVFAALIFLLTYSWNASFARWDQNSFFYVPNATKGAALLIIAAYVLLRAIKVPWDKGCFSGPNRCSVLDILPIAAISLLLDLSKIAAFCLIALRKLYHPNGTEAS